MSDYGRYMKVLIPEGIYALGTIIFLFMLNGLNKILNSGQYANGNPWELLGHNNNEPVKYFLFALVWGVLGVLLSVYFVFSMKNGYLEFDEIIMTLLSILLNVVLIILLIVFINNPILRAVATCGFVIVAFSYVYAKG